MKIKINTIHIESGEKYFDEEVVLKDKETVLPPNTDYTLVITYPLSKPVRILINSGKKGFSRKRLTNKILKMYHKIYSIEDSTTKVKPGLIPGMLNRNFTDGKFGIWGHDIGDLVLCSIYVNKKNVISIGVDS